MNDEGIILPRLDGPELQSKRLEIFGSDMRLGKILRGTGLVVALFPVQSRLPPKAPTLPKSGLYNRSIRNILIS